MESNILTTAPVTAVITSEQLLSHWQGHRQLTRKLIEKFPADQFFTFSIGGMRPASALIMEMIGMGSSGVHGLATDQWTPMTTLLAHTGKTTPQNKEEYLELWDIVTEQIDDEWSKISDARFQETAKAFDQYEGTVISLLLYFIDNEIHHRGQATVYLRALGIEPPFFWDRY